MKACDTDACFLLRCYSRVLTNLNDPQINKPSNRIALIYLFLFSQPCYFNI